MAPNSSGDDGQRQFARLDVGMRARFITLAGEQLVRLVNLSQNGAQLILSRPENAGAGVLIWLDYEAFGELAWHEEDTIGIVFDDLLRPGILAQTRLRAPSVVREEDARAAQAWVAGEIGDD